MISLDFSMFFWNISICLHPVFWEVLNHCNSTKMPKIYGFFQKAKGPKKYSGVVVPSKLKPRCFLSTMQRREDLVGDPGGKMPG